MSKYGGKFHSSVTSGDRTRFSCEMCGEFEVTGSVLEDSDGLGPGNTLSSVKRAALAHQIRRAWNAGNRPLITTDWLHQFIATAKLPSPRRKAIGIIRFIGDSVAASGNPLQILPSGLWTIVGSPTPLFAGDLVKQLYEGDLLSGAEASILGSFSLMQANLTLAGWERYELTKKQGRLSGNYGFLALKLNDPRWTHSSGMS